MTSDINRLIQAATEDLSHDVNESAGIEDSKESHHSLADSQGPATKRELWGWFSYSWASEPFIVSAVGTYVPILLEQFARHNAVRVDDHNIACDSPSQTRFTVRSDNSTLTQPGARVGTSW